MSYLVTAQYLANTRPDRGLGVLAEGCKERTGVDPVELAKRSVQRTKIKKIVLPLIPVAMVVGWLLLYFTLHATVASAIHISYLAVLVGGLGALIVMLLAFPSTIEELSPDHKAASFRLCCDQLLEALQFRLEDIRPLGKGDLQNIVRNKLVEYALKVRRIEEQNAGIPPEHWVGQKRFWSDKMSHLLTPAQALGLFSEDDGYGPFYREADRLRFAGKD